MILRDLLSLLKYCWAKMDTKLQIKVVSIYNLNYSLEYVMKLKETKTLNRFYGRLLAVVMYVIQHNVSLPKLNQKFDFIILSVDV